MPDPESHVPGIAQPELSPKIGLRSQPLAEPGYDEPTMNCATLTGCDAAM